MQVLLRVERDDGSEVRCRVVDVTQETVAASIDYAAKQMTRYLAFEATAEEAMVVDTGLR